MSRNVKPLKVVFAGTPEFAAHALRAIINMGQKIILQAVLTQPDRPAGRGLLLQPSPVKILAIENNISVLQPISLKINGKYPEIATEHIQQLQALKPDVMIVAAYGLILPKAILNIPNFGCINIHASLLPRWRGAAPIHRAIEMGDTESGVTLMQMDEGLDTGAIINMEQLSIEKNMTTAQLHDQLADLGAKMIVEALDKLIINQQYLVSVPQPYEGITYADKIKKEEACIDWHLNAESLSCKIRAFNPFPGAYTLFSEKNKMIKVWDVEVVQSPSLKESPIIGTVLDINTQGIIVACGNNTALLLKNLQKAGGKKQPAAIFLQGFDLKIGDIFS